ncbi:hypothetical protein EI94DRAFT_98833 [Lactarius quietus]|nr:hypothetical protein EI94DRAFT_98833 [Lactarius quietus]
MHSRGEEEQAEQFPRHHFPDYHSQANTGSRVISAFIPRPTSVGVYSSTRPLRRGQWVIWTARWVNQPSCGTVSSLRVSAPSCSFSLLETCGHYLNGSTEVAASSSQYVEILYGALIMGRMAIAYMHSFSCCTRRRPWTSTEFTRGQSFSLREMRTI